ncbi:MAG: ABC transporter permease [Armatimonadota bacterium]|nr:ABC transporter permease [Armatimonadota bacterium]MDR5697599.1 ABC transporter permease [Armatimonadota bacterium]
MSALRVVGATALREWRMWLRYPLFVAAFFLWPVLFGFGLVFTARALAGPEGAAAGFLSSAGTADYATFLALGTATWMILNWSLWVLGMSLRQEQWRGTLEAVWATPAPISLVMLGWAVASSAGSLVGFAVTFLQFDLLLGASWRGNALGVAVVLAASMPALYGFGVLFASLVLWAKEAQAAVFFVRGVFTICAGITYPLSMLPQQMQAFAWWLPMTHMVEGVRLAGLHGAALPELLPTVGVLLAFGAVLVVLGQRALAWCDRRVKTLGTTGVF